MLYTLDTNVLLQNPNSINGFPNEEVVLYIGVLSEIDKKKTAPGELGFNARTINRMLSEMDNLCTGQRLENGGTLRVSFDTCKVIGLDSGCMDDSILGCALYLKNQGKLVTMVTNDCNLRVKSQAIGIPTKRFDGVERDETAFTGRASFAVDDSIIDEFNRGGELSMASQGLMPNEFVELISSTDPSRTAIGIFNGKTDLVEALPPQVKPFGLYLRSQEQAMAVALLLNSDLSLITLSGHAGSGKTLICLACALELVLEQQKFQKLLIIRNPISCGQDVGFLPGPQPMDAKVATPFGWELMGNLTVGSYVIGRDGKKTKVLGIFKKGIKDVYKVTTTDGTSTECCLDHLWYTQTAEEVKRGKPGSVKTTKDMLDNLRKPNGKWNQFIPRNEPVEYEGNGKLPIPPYTLGCLIGDGSLGGSISLAGIDQDLFAKVRQEMALSGIDVVPIASSISCNFRDLLYNNKPAKPVIITDVSTGIEEIYHSVGVASAITGVGRGALGDRCRRGVTIDNKSYRFGVCSVRWTNSVKNSIEALGLLGKKAWDKFIPEMYKFASISDRVELLRGLMDTDGTVKERTGECNFTTTSLVLAEDFQELVRSLGGRSSIRARDRIGHTTHVLDRHGIDRTITSQRIAYDVSISLPFNPFFIPRKSSRYKYSYSQRVKIESIEKVGEKEVQCILVDSPEHLYLTDGFIVTHNTMEEKLAPWAGSVNDALEILLSGKSKGRGKTAKPMTIEDLKTAGVIEIQPLTYLRGRSLANTLVLIEELQNVSANEVKTILSRISRGSRAFATGDVSQCDKPGNDAHNNGLAYAIEKLRPFNIVGHLQLEQIERSELAKIVGEVM
jgi:predicted ribonuclease YlaK